jgi:hypothetical protein
MIVTLPSSQTESTSSGGFVPLLIGGERGRNGYGIAINPQRWNGMNVHHAQADQIAAL